MPAPTCHIIHRCGPRVHLLCVEMSAGMINNEGVNVDLYIPRKCAAVPPPRGLPSALQLLLDTHPKVANGFVP